MTLSKGRGRGVRFEPAFVERALKLAAESSPEEAAERLKAEGHKVSWRSIREWQHGRAAAKALVRPAIAAPSVEVVELAKGDRAVSLDDLPKGRADRVKAIRQLTVERGLEHNTAQRLAFTWGCSIAEVQEAIDEAAQASAGLEVPKALRLVESRATWTEIRRKALDANDWKSAGVAQAALDKLDGLDGKGAGAAPGGYSKGEVVKLLREIRKALGPWPAAVKVFDGLLARGGDGATAERVGSASPPGTPG